MQRPCRPNQCWNKISMFSLYCDCAMTCKSCWQIIWGLTYKKVVFKIIQRSLWTQHSISYIRMTTFSSHWFFFLCKIRTDLFKRTATSLPLSPYPPLASSATQTIVCREPTSLEWGTSSASVCCRGHKRFHLLCRFISWPVIPFMWFSFSLFFPSLIIFSASYITRSLWACGHGEGGNTHFCWFCSTCDVW